MTSLIVELAENGTNSTSYGHGDYKTTIPSQLIEKGDQIVLKSAFIDSIQQDPSSIRTIVVKETTEDSGICEINVEFGYYYIDWGSVQETSGNLSKTFQKIKNEDDGIASSGLHVPRTGLPYTLNYPISNPQTVVKFLDSCDIFFTPPRNNGVKGKNEIFQYNLMVSYLDYNEATSSVFTNKFGFTISGTDKALSSFILPSHAIKLDKNFIDNAVLSKVIIGFSDPNFTGTIAYPSFPLRVSATATEANLFTAITSSNGLAIFNNFSSVSGIVFRTPPVLNDEVYQLYTQSISFSIPAKTYEAVDLASLISQKMTDVNASGNEVNAGNTYKLANNNLIKTVRQLQKEGGVFTETKKPTFLGKDLDGSYAQFQFTTQFAADTTSPLTQNYILGTSDFALQYDEQHDKMVLQQYHNHLYSDDSSGGGLPQVRVYKTTEAITTANRVGGIFLTKLEPKSLWYGVDSSFKFSDDIIVQPRSLHGLQYDGTTLTTKKTSFEFAELIEGVNCTADEIGIDTFIKKQRQVITAASSGVPEVLSSAFDTVIPFTDLSAGGVVDGEIKSVSQQTINIRSTQTLIDSQNVQKIKKVGAYFKLEVDMPSINQKLIQSNSTNNKIQSIISRFYQSGTYTSSYNEGSIPVVYNGENPVLLTDFRVRILEPDGQVAQQLGNTSTIFIEIIKASPNT